MAKTEKQLGITELDQQAQGERTPGPLHCNFKNGLQTIIYAEDGWVMMDTEVYHTKHGGYYGSKANAAFIVRAWNSHDELVAAVRCLANIPVGQELLEKDEYLDTILYKNGGHSISARDVLKARAALAKATGAQS